MKINESQDWVRKNFDREVRKMGHGIGLAVLLEQAGQLSCVILHGDKSRAEKEITDVLCVLFNMANILEIDLSSAFDRHYQSKDKKEILRKIKSISI